MTRCKQPSISMVDCGWVGHGSVVQGSRITGGAGAVAAVAALPNGRHVTVRTATPSLFRPVSGIGRTVSPVRCGGSSPELAVFFAKRRSINLAARRSGRHHVSRALSEQSRRCAGRCIAAARTRCSLERLQCRTIDPLSVPLLAPVAWFAVLCNVNVPVVWAKRPVPPVIV
jgi:hypothetical protein